MSPQSLVEYGPPISLADAKRVMESAEGEARASGLAVIIAVVDSAAQLTMLHRLDKAQFGSIPVAISKAETAVRFKHSTKTFEDALARSGLGMRLLSIPGLCAIDGG